MESPSINANIFYKYSILAIVWLCERFRPRRSKVLMLSNRVCVKYGSWVTLSEASSLRYISQHTSIPVPKVYCSFRHGDFNYIVMEKMKGEMVGIGFVHRSLESKARIFEQLRAIIAELRSLSPPEKGRISNVDGGPLNDGRIPGVTDIFGPFDTPAEFSKCVRDGLERSPEGASKYPDDVEEMMALQAKDWPLAFTHGDLSSLNILAAGDEITAIIDWETSGWYPKYWEYATAYQVNPQNSFWIDEIDHFLQPLPEEKTIAQTRLKYFNDF